MDYMMDVGPVHLLVIRMCIALKILLLQAKSDFVTLKSSEGLAALPKLVFLRVLRFTDQSGSHRPSMCTYSQITF